MKMHYLSLATAKKYGAGENENHELLKRVFFSASCTTAIITTIHYYSFLFCQLSFFIRCHHHASSKIVNARRRKIIGFSLYLRQ